MTNLADSMRDETAQARAKNEQERKRRQFEESEKAKDKWEKIRHVLRDEVYPKILQDIKETASRGNNSFTFHLGSSSRYGSDEIEAGIKYSYLRERLEADGFKTHWRRTEHNYGDSAAPYIENSYDLEISW
jgi:hypothetical protein